MDNYQDMCSKGRDQRPFGEAHWSSKLTESEVLEIRSLVGKFTNADLASRYGVSKTCISNIRTRTKWAHV